MGYGLDGVFAAMAAANVVTVIVGWAITTGKFVRPRLAWDKALVKEMLHLCLSIGFSRSTRVLYWRIGTMLMLALVPGSAQAKYYAIGIYNTASNLIRKAATFQSTVARPLLPIAARAIDDRARLQLLHKMSFKMLLLVSVPMCGVAMAASPILIQWLSGRHFHSQADGLGFAPAVPLLAFSGLMLLTTYALSSVRVMVVALEMQSFLLKHSIIMLVINIVLDVILIPVFARFNAAWWAPAISALVAELYVALVLLVAVSRRVGAYPDAGDALRILFCGALMVAAGWYAGTVWPPAPFIVAPLVYVLAIVLTRSVRGEELAMLRGRRGEGRGRGRRAMREEGARRTEEADQRAESFLDDVERTT
jgi:O-antigen/teichoic acid export membrane protein